MTDAAPLRVIVDSYAWIKKGDVAPTLLESLRKKLTLIPEVHGQFGGEEADDPDPLPLFKENAEWFGMPREWYLARRGDNHEVHYRGLPGDKSTWPGDLVWNGAIQLRAEQQSALDSLVTGFQSDPPELGRITEAKPGWGKCLSFSSWYVDGVTGYRRTVGESVGYRVTVPSLTESGVIEYRPASRVWASGAKPCFGLLLASGQSLDASADHPVLTPSGYRELSSLAVGDLVAAARKVPAPAQPLRMTRDAILVSAALLMDGSTGHSTTTYTKGDRALKDAVKAAAMSLPGFEGFGREVYEKGAYYVTLCGLVPWTTEHGLRGRSKEKRVPAELFGLADDDLALFLRWVWTDGNIYVRSPRKIELCLASEPFIDDVQYLLRRFGIVARKSYKPKSIRSKDGSKKVYPAWRLQIADAPNQLLFLDRIGVVPGKESECAMLRAELDGLRSTPNWDVVPIGRAELREIQASDGTGVWAQPGGLGADSYMGRDRFQRLCAASGYAGRFARFAEMADSIVWERVREITPLGEKPVYDLTVPGTENAVANGIVVHNTIFALAAIHALQTPTLVICHKEFLVEQWMERIHGNPKKTPAVLPTLLNAKVGFAQEDRCDFEGKHIVIGMVHSLGKRVYPKAFYRWPGLVIVDECFVSGTPVEAVTGPVAIEAVRPGDQVLNAAGVGTVMAVSSRPVRVESLVLVTLSDGTEWVCTEDHPWLLSDGWCSAVGLDGFEVIDFAGCIEAMIGHGINAVRGLREAVQAAAGSARSLLLEAVLRGCEGGDAEAVRGLRPAGEANAEPFLFAALSTELDHRAYPHAGGSRGAVSTRDSDTPRAPGDGGGVLGSYDREQPDGSAGGSGNRLRGAAVDRAQASGAGGQWPGDASPAADPSRGPRGGLDGGARHSDGAAEIERLSAGLQSGSRAYREDACDRGGRPESRDAAREGQRREADRVVGGSRVARVSRLQPADIERLGIRVDGRGEVVVHNLSVSGHPSYVLGNGVVVHNCHRIGARTWSMVPARFPAKHRLGVSATLRRKDGCERVFLDHLGPIRFTATEQRLGVQVRRVDTGYKLVKTAKFNPALASRPLLLTFMVSNAARNRTVVRQLAQALAKGRKCLIVSERLEHLDKLEALFRAEWAAGSTDPVPSTGFYVGGMSSEARDVSATKQAIFATYQYVSEGLDIPALDTLFLSTPWSDIEQVVGRIQRPHPTKKPPIVVDFRDDEITMFRRNGELRDRYYRKVAPPPRAA